MAYMQSYTGRKNITREQLTPGMILADGFVVERLTEHGSAMLAHGLAYGFIPSTRFVGDSPFYGLTIAYAEN